MKPFVALLTTFVLGCASSAAVIPIQYGFADIPARAGIQLTYTNASKRMMCLMPEHWPNQAGKINQAADYVSLIVDGVSYPIEDFNTGYCIGGCPTYVSPGETITGFISYRDFNLPVELFSRPKALEFSPRAFACKRDTTAN
jgi:hypothetical protein